MASFDWKRGFFTTTRGRILLLLRRARRSIKELAGALDLTENAVRAHLATMQRFGLVEQGVRRTPGAGRPEYEYRLAIQARSMFPVADGVVLDSLLGNLEHDMNPAEYQELLRTAGQQLAKRYPAPQNGLRTRLEEVIRVLDDLGAVMELEEEGDKFVICGYSCPLANVVQQHPQACKLIEAMLTAMLGVPVREQCERGELLACRLEVSQSA